MINCGVEVVKNVYYGANSYRMTLCVPYKGKIAAGQFAHIQVADTTYPLLRRPFSFYDVARKGKNTIVDILYTVVGKGTALLANKKRGSKVGFLGPLGIGFNINKKAKVAIFVAGGVGIVPFYIFAKQYKAAPRTKLVLLFGARTKDALIGISDFRKLGIETHSATDDGSAGLKGFVTTLFEKYIDALDTKNIQCYGCGPEPMLEKLVHIVKRRKVPCELSLETRMGCALGACRACVTKVATSNGDWRYSRVCCEGPTYDARDLIV